MINENVLYIYTDGSCLPKPRRGGIGIRYLWINKSGGVEKEDLLLPGYKASTNNQMELTACVIGIKNLAKLKIELQFNKVEIRSDSRYVVDNVKRAIFVWPRQKWFDLNGKPILNAKLWKDLVREIKKVKCRIEFQWIEGHSRDEDNKAVDKLAKESAKTPTKAAISVVTVRRKKSSKKLLLGSVKNEGQEIAVRIITSEFLRQQRLSKYTFEVISEDSKYFENVDVAYSNLDLRAGHSYTVTLNAIQGNPRFETLIKEIEKGDLI